MDSSKRVKLSLRVIKEKKTLDSATNVSDCIENEATKHEFEGLEINLKTTNDKLNHSCSSQKQHNSEIISRPSRNVGHHLTTWTTWTPLPDLQWNESDNSVQVVSATTEYQTRKTYDSLSNGYSQVPKTEWIPLPMPCLRCLCSRSASSKFTQRAADKSDSALIKTSKLVHDSKNDTRKVDSPLPDVLSNPETLFSVNTNNPETLLSVNTKSVAVGTSSVSCDTNSRANILQTSKSHLPIGRGSEVDNSRQGLGIEHSKRFPFPRADQPPHPNDSRILQKAHSQLSARPVFIPKANSLVMRDHSTTNMQISTAISTPLRITTNKVSSHSLQKPLMSIPNPPGSSPLELRGLGFDVSTSNTYKTPCAKGQESNSTLLLQQCPLCAVQFGSSLGQIEQDSHIAACLSAAEEDVVW